MTYQSVSTVQTCSTKPSLTGKVTVAKVSEPCAGNFQKNFKDNQFTLKPGELENLLEKPESFELSKCIEDRLKNGAEIDHISITSSASALDNGGEAAAKFCEKGFLGLSKARREIAEMEILPGLMDKAGHGNLDIKGKIKRNSEGEHGDGTSGECPYDYKNGKDELKALYKTDAGRATLDQNRYVKIHITFNGTVKSEVDKFTTYQPLYSCRRVIFSCKKP